MASNKSSLVVCAFSILVILGDGSRAASLAHKSSLSKKSPSRARASLRRDFSAPSPIMTVEADALENSSTISIESVLNQYPQFVPDGTQFDGANIEPSAFETPGISNVNLRGLGSGRNLVLVDGRRLQPANATLDRRRRHDTDGCDPQRRGDHGRRVVGVWRGRDQRRREFHSQGRFRGHRHRPADGRHAGRRR